VWVIDYPLLERIYYALVAGFDVYGTTAHQMASRFYMDELRVEAESYFLDFLPPGNRQEIMQSWYKGIDPGKINYYPSALPAKLSFTSNDPKREFVEHIVDSHLLTATGIAFDTVNYLRAGADYMLQPDKFETTEDYLRAIRALSVPGSPFFALVNGSNSNLAFVRIRREKARDVAFSIVINRWHDNVTFVIKEDKHLDSSKDSADIINGLIGSYPNYFFDVQEKDLPDFVDFLAHFDNSQKNMARMDTYGVNRADERLWETYDWFQKRHNEDEPVLGGLFDMNRYYYRAH
jgi:hypothetical protein